MEDVAGRALPSGRLIDERLLLARVAFWLVVLGVWAALQLLRRLRGLRVRYYS
ncbi:MAG TPA: hypothetical protein VEM59_04485 [Acidimicrobiia bacterium]|nr:hypothetical protein [Acidimicrobiia bacterium]